MTIPLCVGQKVRSSVEFGTTNDPDTSVLTDPTAVKFKVRDPNGAERTLVYGVDSRVTRDGVGLYHCDVLLTASSKPGKLWVFRWVGTGALATANEIGIEVQRSAFDKPL